MEHREIKNIGARYDITIKCKDGPDIVIPPGRVAEIALKAPPFWIRIVESLAGKRNQYRFSKGRLLDEGEGRFEEV